MPDPIDTTPETFIALIEARPFLRECIGRSLQSSISLRVMTFSTLSEQSDQLNAASAALVIVSLIEAGEEAWASALKDLSECAVGSPVVILASTDDVDRARAAIRHGAGD